MPAIAVSPPDRAFIQKVQFLVRPDAGNLYTALTLPVGAPPTSLVLLCPPTFDEHTRAYPIMREYARRLAIRGIGALRFDFFATGDSAGASEQFTMRSGIDDIDFLLTWMSNEFRGVSIVPIGVRLGARLLLDAIARRGADAHVRMPILWDPILDIGNYLFTGLRATLSTAMLVFQAQVASREDIIAETLEKGYCERGRYRINKCDGFPISAELLREAGFAAPSPSGWSYPEAVTVLATVGAASTADRVRRQLAPMLPKMDLQTVECSPYWNQQPVYSQVRDNLFAATDRGLLQCLA